LETQRGIGSVVVRAGEQVFRGVTGAHRIVRKNKLQSLIGGGICDFLHQLPLFTSGIPNHSHQGIGFGGFVETDLLDSIGDLANPFAGKFHWFRF